MAHQRGTWPHGTGVRRRTLAGRSAALALVLCATWTGCSIDEHYDVLSFFFDGVPDPNAPMMLGNADADDGEAYFVASIHSDYAARNCEACHGGQGRAGKGRTLVGFGGIGADICLTCHEGVQEEFPIMHGPVLSNDCLWCHQPHESRYDNLLKRGSPRLCMDCHGTSMRGAPQPIEHEDLERDCLECHHGHGGATHYFIREPDTEKPKGIEEVLLEVDPTVSPASEGSLNEERPH